MVFFHFDDGSFVPSGIRMVVRAASATLRHVPMTFKYLSEVFSMAGIIPYAQKRRRQKAGAAFSMQFRVNLPAGVPRSAITTAEAATAATAAEASASAAETTTAAAATFFLRLGL